MMRNAARMGVFAACAFAVAAVSGGLTAADKATSVKEVMKAMNGKGGYVAKTVAAGKAGEWDKAAELGSQAAVYAAAICDLKPNKGDDGSWTKLTDKYKMVGADIESAAKAKDLKKLEASAKAFGGACKSCHSAHK